MRQHIKTIEEILTLRNVFNFIIMFLASGVLFVAMLYLFFSADGKEKKMQCIQYQDYSKELVGFWISASDKVACDNVGIVIDAPVH